MKAVFAVFRLPVPHQAVKPNNRKTAMKTKLAQTAAALLLALSLTQAQADVVFEDPPWN